MIDKSKMCKKGEENWTETEISSRKPDTNRVDDTKSRVQATVSKLLVLNLRLPHWDLDTKTLGTQRWVQSRPCTHNYTSDDPYTHP